MSTHPITENVHRLASEWAALADDLPPYVRALGEETIIDLARMTGALPDEQGRRVDLNQLRRIVARAMEHEDATS